MLKDYKVNVTKLCEFCGFSRQYFYDLCNEDISPSLAKAVSICYYLKKYGGYESVTLSDLFPAEMALLDCYI